MFEEKKLSFINPTISDTYVFHIRRTLNVTNKKKHGKIKRKKSMNFSGCNKQDPINCNIFQVQTEI